MADEKTPEQIEAEEKAAAEAAAAADKKKKTKFTPEQVEHINELYNKAFKDGATKAEEAVKAALEAEKAEREKLAKQLEDLQKASTKPKEETPPKSDPQLEQFKAQLEEMKGILGGIKSERDELKKRVETADEQSRKARKKDAFLNAMKEADVSFFDPVEAYELAEREGLDWDRDNDRPVVLNKETNRPKLNENGEPMNVIDFVKSFAEKKKYLVKAPNQDGGTGGSTQRKHERAEEKTSEMPDFSKMTNAEFEAYTQRILSKR